MKVVILLDNESTLTLPEWSGSNPKNLAQEIAVKSRLGEPLLITDSAGRVILIVPASKVATVHFDYQDDISSDLESLLERGKERHRPATTPPAEPPA